MQSLLSVKIWSSTRIDDDGAMRDAVCVGALLWLIWVAVLAAQLCFALWPALELAELNEVLCAHVNGAIADIVANRQSLHEAEVATDFVEVVCGRRRHKQSAKHSYYSESTSRHYTMKLGDRAAELRRKLAKYSMQRSALDILHQLLCAVEETPCCLRLLGCVVNKASLRKFFVFCVLSQIFSLMWAAT